MLAASVGLHGKVILLAGGETADREVVDTVDVLTIDGALNSSTMFKPLGRVMQLLTGDFYLLWDFFIGPWPSIWSKSWQTIHKHGTGERR